MYAWVRGQDTCAYYYNNKHNQVALINKDPSARSQCL